VTLTLSTPFDMTGFQDGSAIDIDTAKTAITIVGNGAVFDAGGKDRLFVLHWGVTLVMSHVTLQNGVGYSPLYNTGLTSRSDDVRSRRVVVVMVVRFMSTAPPPCRTASFLGTLHRWASYVCVEESRGVDQMRYIVFKLRHYGGTTSIAATDSHRAPSCPSLHPLCALSHVDVIDPALLHANHYTRPHAVLVPDSHPPSDDVCLCRRRATVVRLTSTAPSPCRTASSLGTPHRWASYVCVE
jgi:hypothetical protein